jgi:hypothetical protein
MKRVTSLKKTKLKKRMPNSPNLQWLNLNKGFSHARAPFSDKALLEAS